MLLSSEDNFDSQRMALISEVVTRLHDATAVPGGGGGGGGHAPGGDDRLIHVACSGLYIRLKDGIETTLLVRPLTTRSHANDSSDSPAGILFAKP